MYITHVLSRISCTYIHAHIAYILTYIHTQEVHNTCGKDFMHTHTHTYIHAYIHIYKDTVYTCRQEYHAYTHMHACIHTYIHTYNSEYLAFLSSFHESATDMQQESVAYFPAIFLSCMYGINVSSFQESATDMQQESITAFPAKWIMHVLYACKLTS